MPNRKLFGICLILDTTKKQHSSLVKSIKCQGPQMSLWFSYISCLPLGFIMSLDQQTDWKILLDCSNTVMQEVYANGERVTSPCARYHLTRIYHDSDIFKTHSPRYFMCEGALVMCPTSVWMSPLLLHYTDTVGTLIPVELKKNWTLPRRSAHFMLNVAANVERQGWRKVQKASRLPAASHGRIEPLSGCSL